ncbi:MAG: class I SAM-dependent methyltransferase, partial [Nitratireductor sp.]
DIEYDEGADKDFLRSLIGPETRTILEIPSGVGRNVLSIAKSGRSIVAVDREPEMIRRLKERLEEQGLTEVEALVGDLCSLNLGRLFDLILVPREAFQLLHDTADAKRCLLTLRRHLSDRGVLLIDLSPFEPVSAEQSDLAPGYFDPAVEDDTWVLEWKRPINEEQELTRYRSQKRNPNSTIDITFRFLRQCRGATVEETQARISVRTYSAQEFAELCDMAGLQVVSFFGNYEREPYKAGDPRMLFVLAKTPDADEQDLISVPSGFVQNIAGGFSNERDAMRLKEFSGVTLRQELRAYFERYSETYFSGPFIEGQGAEAVLEAMRDYVVGGRALDLGAGTSTLFWYLPVRNLSSLSCADISPEALEVLDRFIKSDRRPACYEWASSHFPVRRDALAHLRACFREYLIFDFLSPWPTMLDEERYDVVTAFGSLALAKDAVQYAGSFRQMAAHMNVCGRAVGADWIRRPAFAAKDGHDNSYLSEEVVRSALIKADLQPLLHERIEILGDPLYEAIVLWAGEKRAVS